MDKSKIYAYYVYKRYIQNIWRKDIYSFYLTFYTWSIWGNIIAVLKYSA